MADKEIIIYKKECYNEPYCSLNQVLEQLKAENKHLSEKEEEARHYLEEAEKFKNCLSEIKEIVEGCQYGDCHECKYQQRTDCRTELIAKIVKKISECEVK